MKSYNTKHLDNPIWHSFTTCHKEYAMRTGGIIKCLPEILPFFAVEQPTEDNLNKIVPWLSGSQPLSLLGECPPVPKDLMLNYTKGVFQMVANANRFLPKVNNPYIHRIRNMNEVLEIKKSVDPSFFENETFKLGRFFGIRIDHKLVAIAGERMKISGFTEISSVCTLPQFRGRGYAAQLVTYIHNLNLSEGNIPFLHVVEGNNGALKLYERLGFTTRTKLQISNFSLRCS